MSRARTVLAGIAAVLALLCIGVLGAHQVAPGLLPSSWSAADDATDRDGDVTVAARKAVLAFVTYDYRTIDADIKKLRTQATGSFKDDVENYGVTLATTARNQKSVSSGSVVKVGIGKITGSSAVVDVAATKNQVDGVTGKVADAPATAAKATFEYLFELTLTKVGGAWKVSKLDVAVVS
ncbi:MAG: hypothetical protein ACJ72D_14635 [Marmoricola sp.]